MEGPTKEHQAVEECDLEYKGHVAAPGYGVSFVCANPECGRPWLKVGASYYDPREQAFELQPCDVI